MKNLKIGFQGIDANSDSLQVIEYEVDPLLKELCFGEKGNNIVTV